ncbi:hypothetical protein F4779DRAFT_621102 [Xylariaceae sp. FL0662B]|nr:hypothetical protein F4779DRAFT_621102 [Xylariaceae sp. FL0662B]
MAPTGGPHSSSAPHSNLTEGWQVAASNSTLNAWFGSRQPSWLVNAKPVKPTPRPIPPRQPSLATQNTQITHPVATPSQSASVSVLSSGSASALSPAPPRQSHSLRPPQRPLLQTHLSAPVADTVLPSPAPSDEPSPGISNSRESPAATNSSSPKSFNGLPVTTAHFVPNGTIDAGREGQDQNHVSHASRRPTSRQSSEASAGSKAHTPVNMVLNTPPTPTVSSFNVHVAPREQFENPPAKRRRAGNSSVVFLESLQASNKLRSHISNCGGEQSLETYIERPRYSLLKQACDEGDLFFVALHQLFCTWAMCQANVHRLCDERVHDLSLVDNAFGIMGTILKSNSKLRRQHLEWFTGFPAPLDDLCRNPIYVNALKQVLDFLMCVSHKWMVVYHNHQSNGYPFLVSELLDTFLLFSPILQGIVFRASRRTLGVEDGPIAAQVEDLFRRDQQVHRNAEGLFVRRPMSAEYQEYNESIIKTYRSLIAPRRASQGHAGTSQRPTPTRSPATQPQGYHRDPRMSPQIQQVSNQTTQFVSAPIPSSNSTSIAIPANNFPYPQSPVNYAPNRQNLAVATNSSTHNPVPVQLALPSNCMPPNTLTTTAPSSFTPQYYPYNASVQAQVSRPDVRVQRILQQLLQHQQEVPGRTQSPSVATSASPRLSGVQTATGQRHHQMLSTSQRASNLQNISGQSMPSMRRMSIMSPSPLQSPNGNLGFNPAMLNTHHSPQATYTPTHFLHPQVYPQQPSNIQPPLTSPPIDRLVPPPKVHISIQDYPHTPYDKRAVEGALHQAHTRSPRRIPRELDLPGSSERHYQAVKFFLLSPVAAPPQPYLHNFKFIISEDDYARISRDEVVRGEYLPVNRYYSGSLRVRIRCCSKEKSIDSIPENVWVTAETNWPEHIFMELNGRAMGIKRKAHHSKDLPVEASSYVVQGENNLSILIPKEVSMPFGYGPYIAVEIVEVLSHSAILDMVKTSGIVPSGRTRDEVKRRLAGLSSKNTDDDDLTMLGDGLSIDLADPFNLSIFKVPVRGKSCTHLECFDLETWLNTRLGKKSCYCGSGSDCKRCPKEPSFVDKWKCPLCDGDARPYSLCIDEFLVEVRAQLEGENQLRTKSISVFADGTWRTKETDADDSDVDSDNDANAPTVTMGSRSSTNPPHREKPQVEVIELDD